MSRSKGRFQHIAILTGKAILWSGLFVLLRVLDNAGFESGNQQTSAWFLFCAMLLSSGLMLLWAVHQNSRPVYLKLLTWDAVTDLPACLSLLLVVIPDGSNQFHLLYSVLFHFILGAKALLITLAVAAGASRHSISKLSLWIFLMIGWFHGFHFAVTPTETYGDEPHYLLMTHSLLNDFDLNLHDEYQDQVYLDFYSNVLEPKPSDLNTSNEIRSRGLGFVFSFLLIPAYWLAGFFGVSTFMIILTQLLLVQTFRFYSDATGDRKSSFICVVLLGTTVPILLYAHLIYPDIAGALIIITCLRLLISPHFTVRRKYYPIVFIALTGLLILLKFRYFFPSLVLMAAGLSQLKSHPRRMIAHALGTVAVVLGYFAIDSILLNGELFANRFGDFEQIKQYLPDIASFIVIPGFFLDQEAGFIWLAPVFFFAIPGIRLWSRPKSAIFWSCVTLFPVILFSLLGHSAWHSLPTPPLRYIIPALPALFVFSVHTLQRFQELRIELRVFLYLCLFVSYLVGFFLLVEPTWQHNYADGTSSMIESIGQSLGLPVTTLLPSLTRPSSNVLIWIIILTVILSLLWRRHHYRLWPLRISIPLLLLSSFSSIFLIGCFVASIYPNRLIDAEDAYLSHPVGGFRFPENPDPFYHQYEHHGWVLTPEAELKPEFVMTNRLTNLIVSAKLHDSSQPVRVVVWAGPRPIAYFDVSAIFWQNYLLPLPSDQEGLPIHLRLNPKETHGAIIDSMQIVHRSQWISHVFLRCSDLFHLLGWEQLHLTAMEYGLIRSRAEVPDAFRKAFNPTALRTVSIGGSAAEELDSKYFDRVLELSKDRNWEKLFYFERLFSFTAIRKIDTDYMRHYLIDEVKYGPGASIIPRLIEFQNSSPNDLDIQLGLAISYYKRGDFYKLIQSFESLISSGECPGLTLSEPQNIKSCSRQFLKILNEISDSSDYRKALGDYLGGVLHGILRAYADQDYELCVSGLNRLSQLHPLYLREHLLELPADFNRMLIPRLSFITVKDVLWLTEEFLQKKRYNEALICAEIALSKDPTSSVTRLALARTLFARGELDDARQQCLVGITLTFENDTSRNALEIILRAIERRSRMIGQPNAEDSEVN